MITLENFNCVETQEIAVVDTSGESGHFSGEGAKYDAIHCRIVNSGNSLALVYFQQGSAPTPSATAPFGRAIVVEPGADLVVNKGMCDYFAAICPVGSTQLWFSAGYGS